MDATHQPNSFVHAANAVKSALVAIVLRHYGLELRQEPATIGSDSREPAVLLSSAFSGSARSQAHRAPQWRHSWRPPDRGLGG
jgi:hypothetical protein